MYSNNYNYNIPQYQRNMYYRGVNNNDQRFFGGFFAPLLLGGVAGYAIGANDRPTYYYYPQPYYYPYPTYYSNNYYYNPYNY